MPKTQHIRVRGDRREPPDTRRLARALIALAQARLEAEAEAEHTAGTVTEEPKRTARREDGPSTERRAS